MTGHGPSLIFEDRSRTVNTTGNAETIELITRDQRRRRWSLAEKSGLVRRSYRAGMSVSLVARQEAVAASLLSHWPKLERQGALMAVSAGEAVVPVFELAAARAEIAKLRRLLGKKTLENESSRKRWGTPPKKSGLRARPYCQGTGNDGRLPGIRAGSLERSCAGNRPAPRGSMAEPNARRMATTNYWPTSATRSLNCQATAESVYGDIKRRRSRIPLCTVKQPLVNIAVWEPVVEKQFHRGLPALAPYLGDLTWKVWRRSRAS
jgi:transposase